MSGERGPNPIGYTLSGHTLQQTRTRCRWPAMTGCVDKRSGDMCGMGAAGGHRMSFGTAAGRETAEGAANVGGKSLARAR